MFGRFTHKTKAPAAPGTLRYLRERYPEKTEQELRHMAARAILGAEQARDNRAVVASASREAQIAEVVAAGAKLAARVDATLASTRNVLAQPAPASVTPASPGRRFLKVPAALHYKFMEVWRRDGIERAAELLKGVQS